MERRKFSRTCGNARGRVSANLRPLNNKLVSKKREYRQYDSEYRQEYLHNCNLKGYGIEVISSFQRAGSEHFSPGERQPESEEGYVDYSDNEHACLPE